jgi:hypothetical protein
MVATAQANQIINAHPESVRLLFKDYGINIKTVTLKDITDAYALFGEPFLLRFYEIADPLTHGLQQPKKTAICTAIS